jgi:putative transposase
MEQVLIARRGSQGRVPEPFLLSSDNGRVFTSRHYTRLVRSYGIKQEFITPHSPQQNGMVERLIQMLKEQCIHRQRYETEQHASRAIAGWIQFYDHRQPHRALNSRTPAAAATAALVAQPMQELLGHYMSALSPFTFVKEPITLSQFAHRIPIPA